MKSLFSLALLALGATAGAAQGPPVEGGAGGVERVAPRAAAVRAEASPEVDGRLDEAVWAQAPAVTGFTQRDPDEGQPASERTEVRIVYTDEALFIGARLYDRGMVTTRLGRRDMLVSSSDWFRVSVDSYLDRRTAYRFDVNPSGVRRDATLGVGGTGGSFFATGFTGPDGDLAWDAVWEARTSVDSAGWVVEMRVPFSQLRFAPAAEQTWGLQLERIIDRRQELSAFAFTPKSEPGGVAAFGELSGLRGIRPGRPLELIPYLLSRGSFLDSGDNPFRSDREIRASAGVDARYAITSNLTLAATVNPDFGQVEVDPAVINLSAFETRYLERRPFFVEGAGSFRFAGALAGPSALAQGMFYSRRIGRAPQLALPGLSDLPETAGILGAVKVTGKTANGWSVGILDAVTSRERGRYLGADGLPATALVEPLTNYFVGRLNRELRRGQTTVGPMFTSVVRDLSDPRAAAVLHSSAYSGGVDLVHEWANRSWNVAAFLVGSHVRGTPEAILRTQRAPTRYFQRPDASTLTLDPAATSLSGYAASVQFRKLSGVHWTGDAWVATTSPGFEMNDAGFQQRADRHAIGGGVRYQELRPAGVLRSWNVFYGNDYAVNWDGDLVDGRNFLRAYAQHLNFWSLTSVLRYEPRRMDDRFTRGGPLARRPHALYGDLMLTSDPRGALGGSVQLGRWADSEGSRIDEAQLSVTVRTSPRWNLALGPSIAHIRQDAQFVTSIPDAAMAATFGTRYIFAPLEQTELSLVTRLNYTFARDLTLELYAQPLVANAEYGIPKQFQRPSAYEFAVYGRDLGTLTREGDRHRIRMDEGGAARSFTVPDRSFTTRSLRGNAVLRWEYRPGSTVYLVWQQERLNRDPMVGFGVDRAVATLLDAQANNVLVLKWTYWFNP